MTGAEKTVDSILVVELGVIAVGVQRKELTEEHANELRAEAYQRQMERARNAAMILVQVADLKVAS